MDSYKHIQGVSHDTTVYLFIYLYVQ